MIFRKERWRPVVGYEGLYEVSARGRVRSRNGILAVNRATKYPSVTLSVAGKRKQALIHQMVAAAFVGERPVGFDVTHDDGNRANNRRHNIVYKTRLENIRDKIRHGTIARGSMIGSAVLEEDKVRDIRSRVGRGELKSAVAKLYGISSTHVKRIVTCESWEHVE